MTKQNRFHPTRGWGDGDQAPETARINACIEAKLRMLSFGAYPRYSAGIMGEVRWRSHFPVVLLGSGWPCKHLGCESGCVCCSSALTGNPSPTSCSSGWLPFRFSTQRGSMVPPTRFSSGISSGDHPFPSAIALISRALGCRVLGSWSLSPGNVCPRSRKEANLQALI